MTRISICPMCSGEIHYGDFVSRSDNKTRICGICAFFEAQHELEAWQSAWKQRAEKNNVMD
jgi:hypothetical protein